MRVRHTLQRLERHAQDWPGPATPPPPGPAPEPQQLAADLVKDFVAAWEAFRKASPERAMDPRQPPTPEYVRLLLDKPLEATTFGDLERLAQADPARMWARWEDVKAAARHALHNGWTAVLALEYLQGKCWPRASYLAVRQALHQAWPPRSGAEMLLLDQMAQYETLRQQWLGLLAREVDQPYLQLRGREGREEPLDQRKLTAAEATQEAVGMVERLQRLYLNAQRALLLLRRGKTPFVVCQAQQVNLTTGPQLNVQPATPGEPPQETGRAHEPSVPGH